MSDESTMPSNVSHEQWCHDRIQTLETELTCYQDEYRAMQLDEARKRRHHDVLCLVLKELVRDDRARRLDMIPGPTVEAARKFADLAYPPPKAEL